MLKKPKKVIHVGMAETEYMNIDPVIDRFSEVMDLTDNERRLLKVYCECGNGFAPSETYLKTQPGLETTPIYFTRNSLDKRNVICVRGGYIYVRWRDYKAMCFADPVLLRMGLPVTRRLSLEPISSSELIKRMTDNELAVLYCDYVELIETLQKLTEDQSDALCRRLTTYSKKMDKIVAKEVYLQEHPDKKAFYFDGFTTDSEDNWDYSREYLDDPMTDPAENKNLPF